MGVISAVNQSGTLATEEQDAIAGQPTTFQNMDAQCGQIL